MSVGCGCNERTRRREGEVLGTTHARKLKSCIYRGEQSTVAGPWPSLAFRNRFHCITEHNPHRACGETKDVCSICCQPLPRMLPRSHPPLRHCSLECAASRTKDLIGRSIGITEPP